MDHHSDISPTATDLPDSSGTTRILLIDDEFQILKGMERIVRGMGFEAVLARDARQALEVLDQLPIAAIVSDIQMPGMSGTELLGEIRKNFIDIPVIFVTGAPSVESASEAVNFGALQYLQKPFPAEELEQALDKAVQMRRLAAIRSRAIKAQGLTESIIADLAGAESRFDATLENLQMAYQPVYRCDDLSVFAFEALMRPKDPILSNPGLVLAAAEQLDRVFDLGRNIRARVTSSLHERPELNLLLNLHPDDLSDPELSDETSPLAKVARRTILEVTERAEIQDSPELGEKIRNLKHLGFRLAIDDLGSGYASLKSFLSLDPDFVKLDISLVRGVHAVPKKQRLIRSIIKLCHETNIGIIAEGVETPEEQAQLIELGCDYLQGFLLGRPGPLPQGRPRERASEMRWE